MAEIEVKPDGSWRAKGEGDRRGLGELGLWHLPDGTIYSSAEAQSKPKQELKPIKQEVGSDSHAALKIGIRKNQNGCWVFNKPGQIQGISPANRSHDNSEDDGQTVFPMSSSATGSGRDGEDGSVNQDGGRKHEICAVNGIEYESMSLNIDPPHGFNDPFAAAPAADAEVIVLSDSDEETDPLMSPVAVYGNTGQDSGGLQFPAPQHGIPDSYYENPALVNGGSSCLGLYNSNDDEFGSTMWPLPSGGQGIPSFQLFGSDADVDPLVDMQHGNLHCSSSINGYSPITETAMGSNAFVPESTGQHSIVNDGLVDNPLAFSNNDPSLQIFLPTRPSDVSTAQSDMGDHPDVSNGIRSEDWTSLRLGDGSRACQRESGAANCSSSGRELQSKDGGLETLADHGM